MEAKEKAKELVTKFLRTYKTSLYPPFNKASDEAKQCALIAVQELINDTDASSPFESNRLEYWQQVKKEIEKL